MAGNVVHVAIRPSPAHGKSQRHRAGAAAVDLCRRHRRSAEDGRQPGKREVTATMKAIRVHAFGGIDAMVVENLPVPVPGSGQVLVRVAAAGVGSWDAWVRSGHSVLPQPLPLTPGADLSGIVEATGPDVTDFRPGDAVFGATNPRFTGAYAEYALAEAAMIARKPDALTHVEAASVPVVGCTAWQMLFDQGALKAGQTVVVLGGGGNVGSYAVQLAALAGARVVATGRAGDLDRIKTLGASDAIAADAPVPAHLAVQADVVIDTVGGAALAGALDWLRDGGALLSAVAEPDRDAAARRQIRAQFVLVAVTSAKLHWLSDQFEMHRLRINAIDVLDLSDARVAHRRLEERDRPPGKIILVP
jgi:NADPH:quinone reductase-like Zn-dependent oxidoreductase